MHATRYHKIHLQKVNEITSTLAIKEVLPVQNKQIQQLKVLKTLD